MEGKPSSQYSSEIIEMIQCGEDETSFWCSSEIFEMCQCGEKKTSSRCSSEIPYNDVSNRVPALGNGRTTIQTEKLGKKVEKTTKAIARMLCFADPALKIHALHCDMVI